MTEVFMTSVHPSPPAGRVRHAAQLARVKHSGSATLFERREPGQRVFGVCNHCAKVLLSILRVKRIAARMRCGFGAYFNPGRFEDYSLVEYWNSELKRWVLVDPQLDATWRKQLNIRHDVFDVPRDKFYGRSCRVSATGAGWLS
jgi:hypothetical protein